MGQFIYVAGYPFPIESNCIAWFEPGGYNSHLNFCEKGVAGPRGMPEPHITEARCVARGGFGPGVVPFEKKGILHDNRYRARRSMGALGRPPAPNGMFTKWSPDALRAAQSTIRQFVIHHDGCLDAAMTYQVLHNERGLSVHFILQNDGTIYQTLDLALAGFQCRSMNETSIGIEMNNRGEADKWPNYYDKAAGGKWAKYKRDIFTVRVNNSKILSYGYTAEQVSAMHALDKALRRALPNMPATYPQIAPGVQAWNTLDPWSLHSYAGWLGHYHETSNKWDPGPFDFKSFFAKEAGRRVFPLGLKEMAGPEMAADPQQASKQAEQFYTNNETGNSGYFPFGRWGDSRLWHTGIHLHVDKGTPVLSPFPGRVVAVRNSSDASIGSVNFVLVKHEFSVGPTLARFFSLYFHLDRLDPKGKREMPAWFAGTPVDAEGTGDSQITLYDEPVGPGQLIGYVGEAGPDELREAQLHFAIFAKDEVGERIDPDDRFWTVLDGTSGGRFCVDKELLKPVDANKDGKLSREELLHFFGADSNAPAERDAMRNLALFAVVEWNEIPDWNDALRSAPEFSDSSTRERLIDEQVVPALWWTAKVARHAGLPKDGVVYSYHPVTFLTWMNQKLAASPSVAEQGGIGNQSEFKGEKTNLIGDIDDVAGESFVDQSDLISADDAKDLTLEDLWNGYGDDK